MFIIKTKAFYYKNAFSQSYQLSNLIIILEFEFTKEACFTSAVQQSPASLSYSARKAVDPNHDMRSEACADHP